MTIANTMSDEIEVSVKFFNDTKGFGFFRQSNKGAPDIFVHLAVLEQFGFQKADMVMDKPAVVDFRSSDKGLIVTKIHSIGDKKTPPTELKTIVDRKDDLFVVKVVEIKTGRHLFEIRKGSMEGEQVGDDLFCLAKARKAIGKVILHIVAESRPTNVVGNGPVKGPSPAVQVRGSGQPKKQKKAA